MEVECEWCLRMQISECRLHRHRKRLLLESCRIGENGNNVNEVLLEGIFNFPIANYYLEHSETM